MTLKLDSTESLHKAITLSRGKQIKGAFDVIPRPLALLVIQFYAVRAASAGI